MFLKDKNPANWCVYKQYRNLVTRKIRNSKKIIFSNMISNSSNDPKDMWKLSHILFYYIN